MASYCYCLLAGDYYEKLLENPASVWCFIRTYPACGPHLMAISYSLYAGSNRYSYNYDQPTALTGAVLIAVRRCLCIILSIWMMQDTHHHIPSVSINSQKVGEKFPTRSSFSHSLAEHSFFFFLFSFFYVLVWDYLTLPILL